MPAITTIAFNNMPYLFTLPPALGPMGYTVLNQTWTNLSSRGEEPCTHITLSLWAVSGRPSGPGAI